MKLLHSVFEVSVGFEFLTILSFLKYDKCKNNAGKDALKRTFNGKVNCL